MLCDIYYIKIHYIHSLLNKSSSVVCLPTVCAKYSDLAIYIKLKYQMALWLHNSSYQLSIMPNNAVNVVAIMCGM